jgi:hypothetical protein
MGGFEVIFLGVVALLVQWLIIYTAVDAALRKNHYRQKADRQMEADLKLLEGEEIDA